MLKFLKERTEETSKRKRKKIGKNTNVQEANNSKSLTTLNNVYKMYHIFSN